MIAPICARGWFGYSDGARKRGASPHLIPPTSTTTPHHKMKQRASHNGEVVVREGEANVENRKSLRLTAVTAVGVVHQ